MEITIDLGNLNQALKDIVAYAQRFESNVTEMVRQTTELGRSEATTNFSTAQYDGRNDVNVTSKVYKKVGEIVASGKTVLFIEFGTGIHYGGGHPEGTSLGYVPGSYGPNGLKDYWFYKGDPGTNGTPSIINPRSIITHGNPANRCLYNAGKEIERNAGRIARGVFK